MDDKTHNQRGSRLVRSVSGACEQISASASSIQAVRVEDPSDDVTAYVPESCYRPIVQLLITDTATRKFAPNDVHQNAVRSTKFALRRSFALQAVQHPRPFEESRVAPDWPLVKHNCWPLPCSRKPRQRRLSVTIPPVTGSNKSILTSLARRFISFHLVHRSNGNDSVVRHQKYLLELPKYFRAD